jgi:hypothetical protein
MKVLVVEDFYPKRYLFYKVGSRNEYQGYWSSSFFEHMMFNAKKVWSKQFDQMNSMEVRIMPIPLKMLPCIQIGFPASAAAVIFDLEADRISSLSIDLAL